MKVLQFCFYIFLFLLFIGCATKYQPTSFTGGFSETKLSENVFNVTFNGNGYTSRERASDFALLRSAEVVKNNGFKYFFISSSEKYLDHDSYTTNKTYHTTFQANNYGNNIYGDAYTTSSGGKTIHFSRPSTDNTIICFVDKPQINGIVYEAEFIIQSIKEKYQIKE